MKDQIIYLLDIYGYEKREYGYVRDNPKGTSQAVTLFKSGKIQMFGWYTGETREINYKIYDTGNIGIDTIEQFEVLIEIFDQYKNIDG